MVYLNRFLCVDAGMLAEPMRLQRVKCHTITTSCQYHKTNIGIIEKHRHPCLFRFLGSEVRCLVVQNPSQAADDLPRSSKKFVADV